MLGCDVPSPSLHCWCSISSPHGVSLDFRAISTLYCWDWARNFTGWIGHKSLIRMSRLLHLLSVYFTWNPFSFLAILTQHVQPTHTATSSSSAIQFLCKWSQPVCLPFLFVASITTWPSIPPLKNSATVKIYLEQNEHWPLNHIEIAGLASMPSSLVFTSLDAELQFRGFLGSRQLETNECPSHWGQGVMHWPSTLQVHY